MTLSKLQKFGGICAILNSAIYIIAFIFYGALVIYPSSNVSAAAEYEFLRSNYFSLIVINLVMYVLFGISLAVLVISLFYRFRAKSPILSSLLSVFGIIWVGLVIASGMVANIGLDSVLKIGASDPEKAISIWSSVNIVIEGLGGGNEIVGGIWVLLISVLPSSESTFGKGLRYFGILVGTFGILTVFPLDIFAELFGVSQAVWFLWIGIVLIKKSVPI